MILHKRKSLFCLSWNQTHIYIFFPSVCQQAIKERNTTSIEGRMPLLNEITKEQQVADTEVYVVTYWTGAGLQNMIIWYKSNQLFRMANIGNFNRREVPQETMKSGSVSFLTWCLHPEKLNGHDKFVCFYVGNIYTNNILVVRPCCQQMLLIHIKFKSLSSHIIPSMVIGAFRDTLPSNHYRYHVYVRKTIWKARKVLF